MGTISRAADVFERAAKVAVMFIMRERERERQRAYVRALWRVKSDCGEYGVRGGGVVCLGYFWCLFIMSYFFSKLLFFNFHIIKLF